MNRNSIGFFIHVFALAVAPYPLSVLIDKAKDINGTMRSFVIFNSHLTASCNLIKTPATNNRCQLVRISDGVAVSFTYCIASKSMSMILFSHLNGVYCCSFVKDDWIEPV